METGMQYVIVVNHEEQYSVWPEFRGEPPEGWKLQGFKGTREICLKKIEEIWTNMVPLSLR